MSQTRPTAFVLEFLQSHPKVRFTTGHIATQLGFTNTQVSHAISTIKRWGEPVQSFGTGVYEYNPDLKEKEAEKAETGTLFEKVSELKNGRILIQCEKGMLFVATPLETQ